MKHSRLPLAILIVSIAMPACRGTGVEPSPAPAAATDAGSVSVDVTANEVRAMTGTATGQQGVFRPSSQCGEPQVAPVGLIVRSTRHVNVRVRNIRARVVPDSMQIQLPPVTFAAPLLIQEFGTNLVEARSQRLFPLQVTVGCGIRSGSVVVDVDADDDHGRSHSGRVTVALR